MVHASHATMRSPSSSDTPQPQRTTHASVPPWKRSGPASAAGPPW
jgi:hypothetical protein